MKVLIKILLISMCFFVACANRSLIQAKEESVPETLVDSFQAGWLEKGSLERHWGYYDKDPNCYSVYFGIYFKTNNCKAETALIQEIMFLEAPIKDAKKGIWYVDAGSRTEYAVKYNADICLKGALTGEYGWDWNVDNKRTACDWPRPIVVTSENFGSKQKAHWKFKSYLVAFNSDRALKSGKWKDGVIELLAVIDWEIKAELSFDKSINKPVLVASIDPNNLVSRKPKPGEIQWNAMPTTKRGWSILVEKINQGPRIHGEINIWHYQYGYLYKKYPEKFWDD